MEKESVSKYFTFVSWVGSHQIILLSNHHTAEVNQDQIDQDLVGTLYQNLTPHTSLKYFFFSANSTHLACFTSGSKCDGGKNVHNKVDPKHLNDIER